MTSQPRPWTPEGRASAQSAKATPSPRFESLDTVLMILTILFGIVFVIGAFFVLMESDAASFMAAGSSLTIMIMCGLGRVVIHIAQTLDRIAADAKELRGIEEWRMRQPGHTAP